MNLKMKINYTCYWYLGGHLPKEGKEIARGLIKVFDDLEHVADYSQRPMPTIALQAVQFVFWVSLVIGTLDNHHTNFSKKSGYRDAGYNPVLLLLLVSNYFHFIWKMANEDIITGIIQKVYEWSSCPFAKIYRRIFLSK